ncbi:glycosyltransferase family 4 protein [Rhodanobacter sp. Si-c]|uniref:Glycosyltransferase family 4 protein n=1 Tax=Rhodanobacter lycopersici TaxID=3162487 RepID=A0ABV3QCF5_9GAMM
MRIAFLCKRRYMGKDVIDDRYGRLYEFPFQLARLGHEVHGFCLDYRSGAEGSSIHAAAPGRLTWHARALGTATAPLRAVAYPFRLLRQLRSLQPDLVVGASDIPHVALTAWLAGKLRLPYAVDLYDNFEGFGQARIPGFVPALRRATRLAGMVTTTSDALATLVRETYRAQGTVVPMPSTVDVSVFRPGERAAAREVLGLPEQATLIGTAGGLLANRGIGELYDAWQTLAAAMPDAHLVLAGPADPGLPPPVGPRVHYLGMLPHRDTATLFQALDLGVIYLRDTLFGRYCFPQKAYEMFACGLPVVASDVGAMPALLAGTPQALYQAGNASDLARAVACQLAARKPAGVEVADWTTIIRRVEPMLAGLTARAS